MIAANLSLFDLLLLLVKELGRDASYVLHGTQQQVPQLRDEHTCILRIQEACQVHLHVFATGVLQHTETNIQMFPRSSQCLNALATRRLSMYKCKVLIIELQTLCLQERPHHCSLT